MCTQLNRDTPSGWQARALAVYQQTREHEIASLQADLAGRIHELTGCSIALNSIYVNADERRATVAVDAVIFRLRWQDLVMIKPCAKCGIGEVESPPLTSLADVGYALSAWQPRCQHCPPEDAVDWVDYEDEALPM
jgi:hypothetical protein